MTLAWLELQKEQANSLLIMISEFASSLSTSLHAMEAESRALALCMLEKG